MFLRKSPNLKEAFAFTRVIFIQFLCYLMVYQQIDSLKYMPFTPSTIPNKQLQLQYEYNHFNPISRRLKKTHLSTTPTTPTPLHSYFPHTQKELRFRDISKDKHPYSSYLTNRQDSDKQNRFTQMQMIGELGRVRKKLQFDSNYDHSKSRDKSLTFSDIIRMSREKKLREESRSKFNTKVIKESRSKGSGGKVFNTLKNRLIGEKHQYKSSKLIIKTQQTALPSEDQQEMVRTSTQFQPSLSCSLSMAPTF